jgi:hypothetical protein
LNEFAPPRQTQTLYRSPIEMKIVLTCSFILVVVGCKSAPPQQTVGVPISTPVDPAAKDPVCCGSYANDDVKRAWADFTHDGKYKLARDHAYVYSWGDLGHPYEDNHQHLTVLVVDTTKTDRNRYSVVIFTAPEGEGGRYRQYWFYRDRDTPNAELGGASGYLFVEGCSVRWNTSRQKYICT